MEPSEWTYFEAAVRKIDATARLLATRQLMGGVSARMDALTVLMGDGSTRKMVLRRPGQRVLLQNAHAAAQDFRILNFVQGIGVKTPHPLLLDESGEIFAQPYLIMEYIEGEPLYTLPQQPGPQHSGPHERRKQANDPIQQMAAQLAKLHAVDVGSAPVDLGFLPRYADVVARMVDASHTEPDISLDEARIRATLQAVWPLSWAGAMPSGLPTGDVLLHGDFWPGNLLWRDGELVAVIDWEDAAIGNPLADFATTRLDVLWVFGREALQRFSRHYQTLCPCDLAQLPYWDLVAALRSASRLAEWAAGWAALGRADITEATMTADRAWFVDQAFAAAQRTNARTG